MELLLFIESIQGIEQKIPLIDGEQLADLMIDFDLGVNKTKSYDVKQKDPDYFFED